MRSSNQPISSTLIVFLFLYPFLIYPWGNNYYYANIKGLYFVSAMVLLAAVAAFVLHWKAALDSRRTLQSGLALSRWLLLLYFVVVLISTAQSKFPSLIGSGTQHQGILILAACGLLFLLARSVLSGRRVRHCLNGLQYSAFLCSFYGILQHLHVQLLPQDVQYQFGGRSFSFFDNPDYFGSYLVLLIPVTVALLLTERKLLRTGMSFIILCTEFVALLGSETRSGWLGAAVAILLLTGYIGWRRQGYGRRWFSVLLILVVLFGLMNWATGYHFSQRAATISHDVHKILTGTNSNTAGASRWFIWKSSLPLIRRHFWWGTGPNTFVQVYNASTIPDYRQYFADHQINDENNDYMQIALTTGVPSLCLYLLFILSVLGGSIRRLFRRSRDEQLLHAGLITAILGYLIQACFNIRVVSVDPYFWLLLGIVSASVLATDETDRNAGPL